jgi:hypothetical protein
MEKEQLVQKIKQGKLGYVNGVWFVMKRLTSVNEIKRYDPEQMCDVYEEQVATSWVREVDVSYNCVNEEWFQIEAIQKEPANVRYFESLASDAVCEAIAKLAMQGGFSCCKKGDWKF